MQRRYGRKDANQQEIHDALLAIGAVPTYIQGVGIGGVSDLLVSFRQEWFVLEVKNGNLPPSRQALTPDETRWIAKQRAHVYLVNSVKQAINVVTKFEKEKNAQRRPTGDSGARG